MSGIINLEETIGKTVGKPRAINPLNVKGSTKANALAWRAISPVKPIKSGVFRFKTHEEAEAWKWKMITQR